MVTNSHYNSHMDCYILVLWKCIYLGSQFLKWILNFENKRPLTNYNLITWQMTIEKHYKKFGNKKHKYLTEGWTNKFQKMLKLSSITAEVSKRFWRRSIYLIFTKNAVSYYSSLRNIKELLKLMFILNFSSCVDKDYRVQHKSAW